MGIILQVLQEEYCVCQCELSIISALCALRVCTTYMCLVCLVEVTSWLMCVQHSSQFIPVLLAAIVISGHGSIF